MKGILKSDKAILKVIDVRKNSKECVERYLFGVRKLNELNSEYLMKYRLIKEIDGYIYLIMSEYLGSLNDYKLKYFLCSSLLRGELSFERDEEDYVFYKNDFYKDILNGLKVIHQNGYCHGNIGHCNIFAEKDHFILSDYCLYLLDEEEFRNRIDRNKGREKEIQEIGEIYDKERMITIINSLREKNRDTFNKENSISNLIEMAESFSDSSDSESEVIYDKYYGWKGKDFISDDIVDLKETVSELSNDLVEAECREILLKKENEELKEENETLKRRFEVYCTSP